MKLFFAFGFLLLAISVHTVVSQDEENPPAGGEGAGAGEGTNSDTANTNEGGETNDETQTGTGETNDETSETGGETNDETQSETASDTEGETNENTESDTASETGGETNDETDSDAASETGGETNDETEAGGEGAQTETEETSGNSTADDDMTKKEKVTDQVMSSPMKCKGAFESCYNATSSVEELRNKGPSMVAEDMLCTYVEKGKSCLTTESEGNVCTADEYEEVRKLACGATRGAVFSFALIGFLALLSKILVQH